uniref:orotidine 5'-phosphate decarboxylase / HUMPS family protein n=1 Tax=uncultured Sphingobium sp. TaxID=316087 RepID=UPI00261FBC1F
MTSPVYVAIDTPDLAKAQHLAGQVRHHVGGLKLGLEFFCANGHHGVHEMSKFGLPIFLDLKLHDIPNTVAKAVQALHMLEPAILTVHAAGGRAMLEDAKAAAGANTKVVAVTVLTSLDDGDLSDIGVAANAADQVRRLALLRPLGPQQLEIGGHLVEHPAPSLVETLTERYFWSGLQAILLGI